MVPQIFERFVSITKNLEFFWKFIQFGSPTCPQVWRYKFGKTSFAHLCFLIFLACARKVKRIVSVKYFTAAVWRGHKMSLQNCTINLLVEWNGHSRITFVHLGNMTANLEWDDIFLSLTWRSYSLCSWQGLYYCGGCLTFPGGKRRRRHSRHQEKWSCIWFKRERWIQETSARQLKQLATWRW